MVKPTLNPRRARQTGRIIPGMENVQPTTAGQTAAHHAAYDAKLKQLGEVR